MEPRRSEANARTLAAYEAAADLYARAHRPGSDAHLAFIDAVAALLPARAAVLEIGSATGYDAALLEQRGLRVCRSDATVAFVLALRSQGLEACELNVITDELGGPWDGIYANAVFLHLSAGELREVLGRAAAAVLPGGLLAFTLKEGDGSAWSTEKLDLPRFFTYWREGPLRSLICDSRWELVSLKRADARREKWFHCICATRS